MLETLRFDRKLEITFEVDDPSSKPRRWEDKLYIVLGEGGGMDMKMDRVCPGLDR